jgi:hypothetical protein
MTDSAQRLRRSGAKIAKTAPIPSEVSLKDDEVYGEFEFRPLRQRVLD